METAVMLAPRETAPMLTDSQLRFVRLHQRHFVEKWQHIFRGAMVRATSDRGMTATLRAEELGSLIDAGLMAQGWGGSIYLTAEGRGI
jgi:hypothetical protein